MPAASFCGGFRRGGSRPRRFATPCWPPPARSTCEWAARLRVFEPNNNYVRVYIPKKEFGPDRVAANGLSDQAADAARRDLRRVRLPRREPVIAARNVSTTALQALNLLNSPFVLQQADVLCRAACAGSARRPDAPSPGVPSSHLAASRRRRSCRREHWSPSTASPRLPGAAQRERIHLRQLMPRPSPVPDQSPNAPRPLNCSTAAASSATPRTGGTVAGRAAWPATACWPRKSRRSARRSIRRGRCRAAAAPAPRAKRVLMIFCSGACSHLDTWDYKPELIKYDGQPMPGRRT